jgi:hypothetical protein
MLSIGELDLWKTQAVSGKALDSQKVVRVITELQTARREIALLMAKVAELERR